MPPPNLHPDYGTNLDILRRPSPNQLREAIRNELRRRAEGIQPEALNGIVDVAASAIDQAIDQASLVSNPPSWPRDALIRGNYVAEPTLAGMDRASGPDRTAYQVATWATRVRVPEFEVYANPTISLDEIRSRRFNLIDHSIIASHPIIEALIRAKTKKSAIVEVPPVPDHDVKCEQCGEIGPGCYQAHNIVPKQRTSFWERLRKNLYHS